MEGLHDPARLPVILFCSEFLRISHGQSRARIDEHVVQAKATPRRRSKRRLSRTAEFDYDRAGRGTAVSCFIDGSLVEWTDKTSMARKVINRKELRAEYDAAAAAEAASTAGEAPAKVTKPKKKAAPRASRAKVVADVRMKLYWGVFNQSLKRIAVYEFDQKEEAEKKAEELSKSGKSPHFVQKVKEAVEQA